MQSRKRSNSTLPSALTAMRHAVEYPDLDAMVAFADLVLPDTTYLERHDVMSMLDRPISEYDGPVDSVRVPVVEPTGNCKPFQEVLIELADEAEALEKTMNDATAAAVGAA